jgi:hypothetical protein
MFVYHSRFLRRGEVWFDNEPTGERVDWIFYRNRSKPPRRAKSRPFYNRLIDLSKTSEQLLSEMESRTVAKIEAAGNEDKISCEWKTITNATQLEEVEGMWNQSIDAKRRWGKFNGEWLGEMIRASALELSVAREPSGALVVSGCLFRDKYRVQQLMIVSPPQTAPTPAVRARTNRASCYLLWNTLVRLKEQGVRHFDFGGWYPGTEDIQLLGSNAFKKSFGGEVICEYECEQIVSLKGWAMLTAARLMERAREFRLKDFKICESRPDEATA